MKNRLMKYLVFFLLLFVAGSLFPTTTSQAASAKVHLTADQNEISVGDTVIVYIKINSGTIFGDFEANLTYDKNILEYKSRESIITGDNGYLRISDMNRDRTDTSRKYALEFKALKMGKCELAFDDKVVVYDESGNEMPVSSDTVNITVKASKSASKNAYLKSMKTSPENISPDFNKKVYSYNINVDNDIKKLIIGAIPEDDKATVSVTGNDYLKEGENKIIITVLAESGDIIEYTIKVFRKTSPTVTITPTVTAGPSVEDDMTASFRIEQRNGENYMICSGSYKLMEPGSEVAIPKGYTKTTLMISDSAITVYTPSKEPQSDFVLIYAENSSGQAGFYQYDKTENTLQRYMQAPANADSGRMDSNNATTIIILLITLCALLGAAIIWLIIRQGSGKEDNLE